MPRLERIFKTFPSQSEKRQRLIDFCTEEVERVRTGELNRISTMEELRQRFGYSMILSVYQALKAAGLNNKERRKMGVELVPSSDLAFLLGLLSGGGSIKLNEGKVSFSSHDDQLIKKFKLTTERVFRRQVHEGIIRDVKNGETFEKQEARFYDVRYAPMLGAIRRESWSQVIVNNHAWLFQKDLYTWSFLEGFFEVRGGFDISPRKAKYIIKLYSSSVDNLNFLADILTRVGIKSFKIAKHPGTIQNVSAITIGHLSDIRIFANNIHSCIPEKEERLEYCRNKDSQKGRTITYSNDEIIGEWEKITTYLSHTPKYREIKKMNSDRVSKISVSVYSRRFGGGNFVKARENLEKIIQERNKKWQQAEKFTQDVNSCLKLYEHRTNKQIRFVPKTKHPFEDQAKRRISELVGWWEPKPNPADLVGPDEAPIKQWLDRKASFKKGLRIGETELKPGQEIQL